MLKNLASEGTEALNKMIGHGWILSLIHKVNRDSDSYTYILVNGNFTIHRSSNGGFTCTYRMNIDDPYDYDEPFCSEKKYFKDPNKAFVYKMQLVRNINRKMHSQIKKIECKLGR